MKFNNKRALKKVLMGHNTIHYKILNHPASKKIVGTSKNFGKGYLGNSWLIYKLERSILNNAFEARKHKVAAKDNIEKDILKTMNKISLMGYEVGNYQKSAEGLTKVTFLKKEDYIYNQKVVLQSFENLDSWSGASTPFGGYAVIIVDELSSLNDYKKNKLMSDLEVVANESIFNNTLKRSVGSANEQMFLLKKKIARLKTQRKCKSCKSNKCYSLQNTDKTIYDKPICKKVKAEIKKIRNLLNLNYEKKFESTFFAFLNLWDVKFYYTKQIMLNIPMKKWINFLFPKCFPLWKLMEEFKGSQNSDKNIPEIEDLWNKHEETIIKHLKKYNYKMKWDKDADRLYVIASVFANPFIYTEYQTNLLQDTINQVKLAVLRLDRFKMAEHLGIPNNKEINELKVYQNSENWLYVNKKEIKKHKIFKIVFGCDWDWKRRVTITPMVFYKENYITKSIVLPQTHFQTKRFRKGEELDINIHIAKIIEKEILKYGLHSKNIKKSVVVDINVPIAAVVIQNYFDENHYKFYLNSMRVAAVVGEFPTYHKKRPNTGWGRLARQNLTNNLFNSDIIKIVNCEENFELIDTFKNIPKNEKTGIRVEDNFINVSGDNWSVKIDTINSFELALWAMRYELYNSFLKKNERNLNG